ncbi:MAG: hypothetical protein AAF231_06310 [Pseudomonadota bacterium]
MDITAQLSQLRSTIPGCHVAAFIDLSARMVLAQDARGKAPQERMDGLADRAVSLLDTPGIGADTPDHAIALSADNQEVFLRSSEDSSYGLCLVCGLATNTQSAVKAGLTMLRGLA